MVINEPCMICKARVRVEVPDEQFAAWQNGMLIQNAMPGLNADEREFIKTRICGKCFDQVTADPTEPSEARAEFLAELSPEERRSYLEGESIFDENDFPDSEDEDTGEFYNDGLHIDGG